MKPFQTIIGIDPDLKKSGAARVCDGILTELESIPFFDLLRVIDREHAAGAHFVLENVEVHRPTFSRGVSQASMRKIAQNVGQVKAVARLLREYLDRIGASYTMLDPLRGVAKSAKKDARIFNRITGWTARSNEDTRDAAMLALHVVRMTSAKATRP